MTMYTIIGGDGKEYGPVTADQIKAWIAAGRANLDTQVKLAGTEEWKRLGDIPALSGGEPPPLATGPLAEGDAQAIASELVARSGKLDVSLCFERSWTLLKANFWPLVGTTALIGAIELSIFCIPVVHGPALVLLGGVFGGGLYNYFLQIVRGRPRSLASAFAGFGPSFVPLMLAGATVWVLTVLGCFLLILPGIYLGVAYLFTYILVVDRRLHFWKAMEVSRRVITAQWWRLFGLVMLGALFLLFGVALLGVGVLVAIPLTVGAIVYAYEDLCKS